MSKRLLLLLTALYFSGCSVSKLPVQSKAVADPGNYVQDISGKPFSNFHGVQISETRVELEGEGMAFLIEKVDLPPTLNSLNKIKNAYMPDGDIYALQETTLPTPNLILLGGEAIGNEFSTTALLFEVPAKDSSIYVIGVESAFMLEFERAGKLVKYIIENGIPEYVVTGKAANTIDFAGRPIELGNVCDWQAPHHVACKGLGELQWSLFNSREDALLASQINMAITEVQTQKLLLKEENVKITFEGKPASAVRVSYLTDRPSVEGSNELVAYYVVTSVRGHHIFCKISFYKDQAGESGLSPLAAKVIAL